MTYEAIEKANATIELTNIKGSEYAMVNQRVKAFRMVYPTGYIHTHFYDLKDGVCTMLAECGYYTEDGRKIELGTGTAQEKEGSSYINRDSYIENCESSAVGRCLGMAGFGIVTAICSAEELENAIKHQEDADQKKQPDVTEDRKATPKQVEVLSKVYTGENLSKLLANNKVDRLEDLSMKKASELISFISKMNERKGSNNG